LACALALCAAASALIVRSYRRKDPIGDLLALMLLLAAGVPASIYGTISSY